MDAETDRKRHALNLLAIAALALLGAGCGSDTSAPDQDHFPDSDPYEWLISSPEEQGLDSTLLSVAVAEARQTGFMDCLLIIRNGHIVTEEYFNAYDNSTAHNVKSVSKSFLSAMVGVALREGYFDHLDQKIAPFFAQEISKAVDPRIHTITLRHLLTMRAGFDSDQNTYEMIYGNANWIRTTLHLPLVDEPGAAFHYNTFAIHLLAVALARATGVPAFDFGKEHLFDPLKITCDHWQTDRQGNYFGGNNMYFTPRDAARLGLL